MSSNRALAAALALVCAGVPAIPDAEARSNGYRAQVFRTSYGIPHIQAQDWGSLGYGYGYAFSRDNVCVLARDLVTATGTQAKFFGVGASSANLAADVTYKMVNSTGRVDAAWAEIDQDTRDLLTGYAAGFNRYLRDTGVANLPADCRNAAWVRSMNGKDVLKVLRKLMVRASTAQFTTGLLAATPPPSGVAALDASPADVAPALAWSSAGSVTPRFAAAGTPAAGETVDLDTLPDWSPERFGSNALALGSELTGGAGALLGNPHFPWFGIERFYAVHLTIPGRYDVMGASIYGFPMVNIGFNRSVAWTHTVSTARRFVLRELSLAPGNPRAYVYEGNVVPMQPETVSVEILGAPAPYVHTLWQTQFGPVVVPAAGAAWTTTRAYALTDANLENSRAFAMYREIGQSRNVQDVHAALSRHVAMPWVNTIAADAQGNAYYADITVVPNVTNAQLVDADCRGSPVAQLLSSARSYTLNGSLAKCDPGTDADAPVPGIFGPSNLPSLLRRDYVHNANDSYWLTNPNQPLEGYSRLIGADERQPQGFRTRVGHDQVNVRSAGGDGLPGSGFGQQWLQDVLYSNRHYSADIMLDGVLQLCRTENNSVTLGGVTTDVGPACQVLANWDRRNRSESVGAHVWTTFWTRLTGTASAGLPPVTGVLYEVPFNVADPVNTPRGLNVANGSVRTRVMGELAQTVRFYATNGIPLDRPWGQVQFDLRNGQPVPIHGGSGGSGVWNAIVTSPAIIPNVGFAPILGGSSYIQAVTFAPSGPDARAIVTYSQSSDPANPHYADMTRLYSRYGWVRMPFSEREMRQDPNFEALVISER